MKLLEYEAKRLLAKHGLLTPRGTVLRNGDEAKTNSFPVVAKVQIPKGGRGKAGGVKLAHTPAELESVAAELLAKPILGYDVKTLLLEEAIKFQREMYIAIVIDRASAGLMLLARCRGGVEVEQASDELLRMALTELPTQEQADRLSDFLGLDEHKNPSSSAVLRLLRSLYETAVQEDALLVEINPLMQAEDGRLICADAKIELDDAAQFRHPEWQFERMPTSSQFVVLNDHGTVASMANGAGLAMATVDAIKAAGAEPANFFDVGGGTNVEGMVQAFQKISDIGQVKAIVVNIFGGITRCDEVAEAIVEAQKQCPTLPKLYIRLTGTNQAEGSEILDKAGIKLYPSLTACVEEAVKL